jgi:hypothetical protein
LSFWQQNDEIFGQKFTASKTFQFCIHTQGIGSVYFY